MNVLVTGAAGFLGRAFTRALIARGDRVTGVDDFSNPHSYWPEGLLQGFRGDIVDYLDRAPGHWDLVFHFAAPVGGRVKIEGDPLFNADSLRIDTAVFRRFAGVHTTLIYPSSSAVYGVVYQQEQGRALTESDVLPGMNMWARPDEMYGFTKLAGEVLASYAARYGLNTLCLRPFSGYGEDQSLEYPVPSIAYRAARHEDPLTVWGPGTQARDFIHVDDLVGGTLARIEAGIDGYAVMNLGSGEPTSFNEVARLCAKAADYAPAIENVAAMPSGVALRYCDPTEFHRYYRPTIGLEEGLARVVARYA